MAPPVEFSVVNDLAVIRMVSAPVNSLSWPLRISLVNALEMAQNRTDVSAIILMGLEKVFSGGADIREFHSVESRQEPTLHQLIFSVENAAKPVIAAIQGLALGGGLELALACHFRVGLSNARIGFPEVTLGLIPGAGGTQRFPRAVPLSQAKAMMQQGGLRRIAEFRETHLFDALWDLGTDRPNKANAFYQQIIAFAHDAVKRLSESGASIPRLRYKNCLTEGLPEETILERFREEASQLRREARPPGLWQAQVGVLEALSAAIRQPFDEGLAFEFQVFLNLLRTPESRALRHMFFAERSTNKIPKDSLGVSSENNFDLKPIQTVRFLETDAQTETVFSKDCIRAGFSVETVREQASLKAELQKNEEGILSISLDSMQYGLLKNISMAERLWGLKWDFPVPDSGVLEIFFSSPDRQQLSVLLDFAKRLGKKPIMVNSPRAIEGDFFQSCFSEIRWLCKKGYATPKRIDKVMKDFGFSLGFFETFSFSSNESTFDSEVANDLMSDEEITHRLIFPLILSGVTLLKKKVFFRASDIDWLMMAGYGFPVWRGGPMRYADEYGLQKIAERVGEFLRSSENFHQLETYRDFLKTLGSRPLTENY